MYIGGVNSLVWIAIAVAGVAAVAIVVSRVLSKEAQVRRGLARLPTIAVRAVKPGQEAKVEGKVRYHEVPLEAPLSGRRCAFYAVRVEVHTEGKGWMPLILEEKGEDFWIEDDTGKLLVRAAGGKIVAVHDASLHSAALSDKRAVNVDAFLARHGHKRDGANLDEPHKQFRFFEGVLEEGEVVTARGVGVLAGGADAGALELHAPRHGHVLVSEAPGHGASVNLTYKV